jgi:hypothetical protein
MARLHADGGSGVPRDRARARRLFAAARDRDPVRMGFSVNLALALLAADELLERCCLFFGVRPPHFDATFAATVTILAAGALFTLGAGYTASNVLAQAMPRSPPPSPPPSPSLPAPRVIAPPPRE